MFIRVAVASLVFAATQAFAGTVGNATVNDVTLGGEAADAFKYANGVNPHGSAGSIGFASAFAAYGTGSWNKIAGFETPKGRSGTDDAVLSTGTLVFNFHNANGKTGDWSVTNTDKTRGVMLDLVFAIHTGGGSGAWLFDDQKILAGQTLDGAWFQKMFNNGRRMGDFSNLTLFARNASQLPPDEIDEVPEPATLGTMALGLGMLGAMRRRKRG